MSAAHPLGSQCTATSKATGLRCRRRVIGAAVCVMHGQNSHVKAKREAQIATYEAAQRQAPIEARDPGDALLAAAMTADELVQRLQQDLRDQEQLQPATLTALGEWLDRTGRLSRSVLDARVDERRTRVSEAQGVQLLTVLTGVLADLGHDLSPGSEAAQVVLRHIEPLRGAVTPLRAIEGGAS